jgi:hypothetical protein
MPPPWGSAGAIMKIRIFPVQKPFLVKKIRADETGGVAK